MHKSCARWCLSVCCVLCVRASVGVGVGVGVEPGRRERGSVQALGYGGGGGASEHAEEAGVDCGRAAPQEVGGRGRG